MKFTRILTVMVSVACVLAITYFLLTKAWQRWDINPDWARSVIASSKDVIEKLDDFNNQHGAFPESLDDLEQKYEQPPNFDTSESECVWQYRPVNNSSDYQLVAIGKSWVSSYDAMVYRKSKSYPKSWFKPFDSSHARAFDGWWYVTGFSGFEKN
jgi:hypothetical protein